MKSLLTRAVFVASWSIILAISLKAQDRLPIIDMHMHTHHPSDVPAGAPALCRPEPCEGRGRSLATSRETLRATLAQMRQYNIVKGFLSGPDPKEVQEWVEESPDRFIPSAFIFEPGQPTPEVLRRKYDSEKLAEWGRSPPSSTDCRRTTPPSNHISISQKKPTFLC